VPDLAKLGTAPHLGLAESTAVSAAFRLVQQGVIRESTATLKVPPRRPNLDHGRGWPGAGSPGTAADKPSRIPRSISPVAAGSPAGAFFWQLQLRLLNGFGSVPAVLLSALAGAAAPIQTPKPIAVLISILAINRWWFAIKVADSPLNMPGMGRPWSVAPTRQMRFSGKS
jgi:hypothetical protein